MQGCVCVLWESSDGVHGEWVGYGVSLPEMWVWTFAGVFLRYAQNVQCRVSDLFLLAVACVFTAQSMRDRGGGDLRSSWGRSTAAHHEAHQEQQAAPAADPASVALGFSDHPSPSRPQLANPLRPPPPPPTQQSLAPHSVPQEMGQLPSLGPALPPGSPARPSPTATTGTVPSSSQPSPAQPTYARPKQFPLAPLQLSPQRPTSAMTWTQVLQQLDPSASGNATTTTATSTLWAQQQQQQQQQHAGQQQGLAAAPSLHSSTPTTSISFTSSLGQQQSYQQQVQLQQQQQHSQHSQQHSASLSGEDWQQHFDDSSNRGVIAAW